MLYSLIKPLLFSLDPETAHNLIIQIASLSTPLGKISGLRPDPRLCLRVGSLKWKSPIGLAAGLDKNAQALDFFEAQGFGAIECGTVTLLAQDGNPRPRIFRYQEEQSLRNTMGFPNQGLLSLLPRLKSYHGVAPLGVNIGKNKNTPALESIEELSLIFETLREEANYFVVNVSSPNTPGLKSLQEKSYLSELFCELNKIRFNKDLYLKIAPDLDETKVIELTELAQEYNLTGIIATNTLPIPEKGAGGISGVLLAEKSKKVRQTILQNKGQLELIAVGGITNSNDLFNLWEAGGKAAQIYTAYIYQGPQVLKNIHQETLKFLNSQNLDLESFFSLSKQERSYRIKNRQH